MQAQYSIVRMGENVIRIEIVMALVEITCYESIDTVALKCRSRKLRPKRQEVEGKGRRRTYLPATPGLIAVYLSARRCPRRRHRCRLLTSLMASLMASLTTLLMTLLMAKSMTWWWSTSTRTASTRDQHNVHDSISIIWVIQITRYGAV
jgi:hypothetical protein